jgi:ubiquinone/menaquinone biosynthesis C-methylase UbiE
MAEAGGRGFLPALRFKALTPYFDAVVRLTTRERLFKERLLDRLGAGPHASVLDVGAGTGTLALQVKERWPEAAVTGLDADADILAIARRKGAADDRQVEWVEALSDAMPFADASFDAAVATLFFHHLDHDGKAATLLEIGRVLKPGGVLHVADYGHPRDPLQAALFMQVRAFDGFAATADNARGALPEMMEATPGLGGVERHERLRTVFGTLELLSARCANGARG